MSKIPPTPVFALTLTACAALAQTPPPTPPRPAADKPPAAVVAGIPVNYDEARPALHAARPAGARQWQAGARCQDVDQQRRPEIVRLFEENQYGRSPGRPDAMSFEVFERARPRSTARRSAGR